MSRCVLWNLEKSDLFNVSMFVSQFQADAYQFLNEHAIGCIVRMKTQVLEEEFELKGAREGETGMKTTTTT